MLKKPHNGPWYKNWWSAPMWHWTHFVFLAAVLLSIAYVEWIHR